MTQEKVHFTNEEINECITHRLSNASNDTIDEIIEDAVSVYFNEPESVAALEQYGLQKASDDIEEYEYEHHGEFFTDMEDTRDAAEKLFFVKGMEYMWESDNARIKALVHDNEGEIVSDSVRAELLSELEKDSPSVVENINFDGKNIEVKTINYLTEDNQMFKSADIHAVLNHDDLPDSQKNKWLTQEDVNSIIYLDSSNEKGKELDAWIHKAFPVKVQNEPISMNQNVTEIER